MCNLAGRHPYGHDALVAGPVDEYEVSPDYSPSPEEHPALPFYDNEECKYLYFYLVLSKKEIIKAELAGCGFF